MRDVPNNNHPFKHEAGCRPLLGVVPRHVELESKRHHQQAHSHGPQTADGDYAAGALSVVAPSLHLSDLLCGACTVRPLSPALRTGLRDGREAKVRAAAASRGRPSAGTKSQPQLPSIYLSPPTNPAIHLPGYLIHRTNISNPDSLLTIRPSRLTPHYLCAI